jgi:ribosomal protein S18 acetylase RimI-like enzyme
MTTSHEIRYAQPHDAEAIAALHIASWRAVYREDLPAEFLDRLDLAERTRLWQSRITDPGNYVQVAARARDVLAFCSSGAAQDADSDATTWEIRNLHVAPTLRRSGLGSALFDTAVAIGRSHEAAELTLWVVATNHAARRFYEQQGMHRDGAQHDYEFSPGAVVSTIRYRKRFK